MCILSSNWVNFTELYNKNICFSYRRFYAPSSRPPWRRTWFVVLVAIILFGLVVYMMAILGRRSNVDIDDVDENNQFLQHHL